MKGKRYYFRKLKYFLQYLGDKRIIKQSLPLVCDQDMIHHLLLIEKLPLKYRHVFFSKMQTENLVAENFYSKTKQLYNGCLKESQYSYWTQLSYRRVWNELFLFLEANDFDYSPALALNWANHMQCYVVQTRIYRRAIKVFEQFNNNGKINPEIVFSYKKDRVEVLPEWCKQELKKLPLLHFVKK
jgi:hypothetical protein